MKRYKVQIITQFIHEDVLSIVASSEKDLQRRLADMVEAKRLREGAEDGDILGIEILSTTFTH
jgi:predicted dinucleotide-utilizing enzyme